MRVLLYDSTFEGLLSAIYEAYYSKDKPEKIFSKRDYQFNLLDNTTDVTTDLIKFQKVYDAIEKKISKESLNKIYYVYLAELKESANIIFDYIKLGFKLGKDVNLHKNNDTVLNIDKISKRVSLEKHRFTGFIRFKDVGGVLIANIEPDNNILPIIGRHFKDRLSNEYFIINDNKRDIALVYDKKNYHITTINKKHQDILNKNEDVGMYEELWKLYFTSVSIEERKNEKLQKRMMPKRYWNNLTEYK